jgi:peptidoglycan hydrolase CwlO-like protein
MASKNITPKLDDNSGMTINIKWLIQIVIVVAMATWGYASIAERIDNSEDDTKNLRANQNNYIFPDIRQLENQVIELQKRVLVLETELKHVKN